MHVCLRFAACDRSCPRPAGNAPFRATPARVAALIVAAVFAAPTLAQPARTHDITIDDYLSVDLISDCRPSPDGRWVAFVDLRWNEPDEQRSNDLWLVEVATRKTQRLTFDRVGAQWPQWSADGQALYFMSKRDRGEEKPPYDGSNQVWCVTEPDQVRPVTRVAGGVQAFQLAGDGRTIYYTKDGAEAERPWADLRKKYPDIVFGHGVFHYTEIWKLSLESWREEKVAAPQRVIESFLVSPDQSQIAMVTVRDNRMLSSEGWSRVDVHDTRTGETTTLPDALYRAQAPSPYGWLGNLAWSWDGGALAWTVTFDGYPTEILVARFTGDGPRVQRLTRPGEIHVSGCLRWSADGRLHFLAEDHARQRIYALGFDADGTQAAGHDVVTPGDVVVHAFDFTGDGRRLAFVMNDPQTSRDVYWLDRARNTGGTSDADTAWTKLTDMNPQMATWRLPQLSILQWTAPDGTPVEGILELPPDYRAGDGPLPTVIEIHGGPTAATLYSLRYWIYGRTILAAKGYALLSPNYRGSTGYGDTFMTDLIGHENDRDVQDILSGVDALVERGIADPDRLGVMGWSNGGFLTNCVITTTDRFKAASSGAGVLHQFMQWGLGATPGHVINYMQGLPWDRVEAYRKASPAFGLGNVQTPTIIHTGANDANVSPASAQALFRALGDYTDVPVVYLEYPGAGHGLAIADHRRAKLEWDLAWFEKYLLEAE